MADQDQGTLFRDDNSRSDEIVELHLETSDPTANNDSSNEYYQGSIWLNTITGQWWLCVDDSVGAAIWQSPAEDIVTPSGDANFFWADGSSSYITVNSNDWATYGTAVFVGTDVWVPDTFLVIAQMSNTGGTGYIRIRDVTNNQTIAEVTLTTDQKVILTDSSLSNLSTDQAIIEIQAKKVSKSIYLYSAGFYYLGV